MRRPPRCFLAGAALLLLPLAPAAAAPQTAPLVASGLDHYYNLEYDAALDDFRAAARLDPESAALANHIAASLLYREMLRIGALESQLYGHGDPFLEEKLLPPDPAAVDAFTSAVDHARALAADAIARNPGDAHAHYDLAASWALRGTCDFVVRKSYLAALSDARQARAEATRSRQLAPGFIDPLLILGVHNYIAGSLPLTEKIFAFAIGYSGDKRLGRAQVEDVIHHGGNAATDATVMLVVLDRRDGLNFDAATLLQRLAALYPRNLLYSVELAECREAAGEHDAARAQYLRILDAANSRQPGFQHAPLDKVWYDLGNIDRLFSRWPAADDDFRHALSAPNAQPRYLQAAALADGEVLIALGNPSAAAAQFRRCVSIDGSTPAAKACSSKLAHR